LHHGARIAPHELALSRAHQRRPPAGRGRPRSRLAVRGRERPGGGPVTPDDVLEAVERLRRHLFRDDYAGPAGVPLVSNDEARELIDRVLEWAAAHNVATDRAPLRAYGMRLAGTIAGTLPRPPIGGALDDLAAFARRLGQAQPPPAAANDRAARVRMALAEMMRIGPKGKQIANHVGVSRSTLLGWPEFREHYDRL